MSNALAIAGTTAVLQSLLTTLIGELSGVLGVNVSMSAIAPEDVPQDANASPCLNLFLYQLTPNPALRNAQLPAVNAAGERLMRPPLAVDLHYLLTAYGNADLQAEILLGMAMQLLQDNPVLTRDTIRKVLNPALPPATPIFQALQHTGLADQFEQIKLSPAAMNLDELSKLWTALQSNFRPSVAYQASVVLIESTRPARAPLPVLSRGPVVTDTTIDPNTLLPVQTRRESGVAVQTDLLPPYPQIDALNIGSGQIAAVIGDTLSFSGHRLDGVPSAYRLRLSNPRLGIAAALGPEIANSGSATGIAFLLTPPDTLPAGGYAAVVELQKAGEPAPRLSNPLPLTVAPQLQAGSLPAAVVLGGATQFTLTPSCIPAVQPGQRVSLLLGEHEACATAFANPTSTPSFTFDDLAPGRYWVRLRVDGVDSLLVDRQQQPPAFVGPQIDVQP